MSISTKSTVISLALRGEVARKDLSDEAKKLLALYSDPDVSPEEKEKVKKRLDEVISVLEDKVATSRHLRNGAQH